MSDLLKGSWHKYLSPKLHWQIIGYMYESFDMSVTAKGVDHGIVEWIQCDYPR